MKPTVLNYRVLTNGALNTCAADSIADVVESGIEGLSTHKRVVHLIDTRERFIDSLGKVRKNYYITELEQAEKSVALALDGIKGGIQQLYSWADSEEDVKNGVLLMERIQSIGVSWRRMKRAAQISYVEKMIREFRSDDFAEAITRGNLERWLDKLEASRIAFDSVRRKKSDNADAIKNTLAATALRDSMIEALKDLFNYVQGTAISNESPEWIALMNTLARRCNELIARSVSKDDSDLSTDQGKDSEEGSSSNPA